jgi:hypothetical protein
MLGWSRLHCHTRPLSRCGSDFHRFSAIIQSTIIHRTITGIQHPSVLTLPAFTASYYNFKLVIKEFYFILQRLNTLFGYCKIQLYCLDKLHLSIIGALKYLYSLLVARNNLLVQFDMNQLLPYLKQLGWGRHWRPFCSF